ncbi:MAG: hypothetical protein JRI52_05175 [Deltaproteobacteria bacterium]|nr:hypothetical protein [Deltaproteobacteria bacterium]
MGYGILWLSHLAFTFFLVAATCAWTSRHEKLAWPRGRPLFVALLALVSVAVYAAFGAELILHNHQPKWLFWYGLSLTVVFITGTFLILRRGLKDIATENPAARSWPRWKLSIVAVVFLLIHGVILNAMETRIMIRLTNDVIKISAELNNHLPVELPDALNARTLYDQASHLLETNSDTKDWFKTLADSDVISDEATTILASHQDALQLLERAVEQPGYTLHIGGANYYTWPMPNYWAYRKLARLQSWSAQRNALEGNLDSALKDLSVIHKMADHLLQYPNELSFRVAGALDATRIAGLEHVLANTDQLIQQKIKFPLKLPPSLLPEFKHSMLVEYYANLVYFLFVGSSEYYRDIANFAELRPVFLLDTLITSLWRVFLLPSEIEFAKEQARIISQDNKSYEDIEKNLKKIDDAFETGECGFLNALLAPRHSTYSHLARQVDARRRLATAALAAAAYQNSTDAYPAELEDLVPNYLDKVPIDPFAPKQPIQMKVVDGGLVLSSKGAAPKPGWSDRGPIHFCLGKKAYEELRAKIAGKEREKKAETRRDKL